MYKFVDNVHYEPNEECSILIDFNNSKFFEVNSSSQLIIDCIKEEKSFEDILNCFLSKYDIDKCKASADISNFINILISNNLIVEVG